MSITLKKIITAPLLALSLMPAVFSVYFLIQLKIARHEAEEKLEASLLQTVTLDRHDFSWIKKGKEISTGGRMFDVKSIVQENGKYIFTGLYDEQEEWLHQQLEQVNNTKNEKAQNNLCNFFFHSYYSIPAPDETAPITGVDERDYNFFISSALPFLFYETVSPPPNIVLI